MSFPNSFVLCKSEEAIEALFAVNVLSYWVMCLKKMK